MLEWDGRSPPSAARAGETRSLGDWGGPLAYDPINGGQAISYGRSLGSLDVPRAGAPEIVSGYESPEPGAATIHLGADPAPAPAPAKFDLGLIRKASALAAGYHGVRRNNGSIFWGLIWAAAAFISPLYGTLVPAFAMAQGFGEARPKSNPARRSRGRKAKSNPAVWQGKKGRRWRRAMDEEGYPVKQFATGEVEYSFGKVSGSTSAKAARAARRRRRLKGSLPRVVGKGRKKRR
jgi:hypothetical protein